MLTIPTPVPTTLADVCPPSLTGPVLVAVDGRSEADSALRAARMIAAERGAALAVLSVVPMVPIISPEIQLPTLADSMAASRAAALSRVRTQLRRVFGSETVPVELADGAPAPVIARRARELGASLIVVGLGHHGITDRFFGSETALQLLHVASTPILAVPPLFAAMPKRAIAALDFSPGAIAALRIAQPYLRSGATLTATYVVTPELASSMYEISHDRLAHTIEDSFASVQDSFTPQDGVSIDRKILRGDPANQILNLAEETGADLIIAGSHGHGFFSRMLLGSVAVGIIRGARCAVLAVPYAAARLSDRRFADVVHVPRRDWVAALNEFSGRNVGCEASLEIDDQELGAQTQDSGYPFAGATFDRNDARVEIMLGELGAGKRHVTRSIGDVASIDILRAPNGCDAMLRVAHGRGQTLLTLDR